MNVSWSKFTTMLQLTIEDEEVIINSFPSLNEVVLYGYEKVDFLPSILQKNLAGIYPLYVIVSSGQGMVLSQENRVSGDHEAVLRGKIVVFGVRLWSIVLRLMQKFKRQLVPQRHNKLLEIGYFEDGSEPGTL
ncbi:uncharacterized protein TNCV_3867241 [Trichonephila clavipes]|nr:uncharacterized protein TNCV_3867241 [Trichonephila clavipes]